MTAQKSDIPSQNSKVPSARMFQVDGAGFCFGSAEGEVGSSGPKLGSFELLYVPSQTEGFYYGI